MARKHRELLMWLIAMLMMFFMGWAVGSHVCEQSMLEEYYHDQQ